jgi:hypothetical protein
MRVNDVFPLSKLTKILLSLEAIFVFIVAMMLSVMIFWGLMGISGVQEILTEVAFMLTTVGCIAMVDLLRRLITAADSTEVEGGQTRFRLAVLAALVSTIAVGLSHRMSSKESWSSGMDFLAVGCVLWVPLAHVALISFLTRRHRRVEVHDSGA